MNVIIIEDEKPAARRLARMVSNLGIEVEATLHSVSESISWFKVNKHPDLILLDIQLSDGISFEIFEQVEVRSQIIFTTAFDEYALKAFKLNSVDYLLKPIDEDELEAAISKAKQRINTLPENLNFDMESIRKLLQNPYDKKYKERFTVKVGQHLKIIPIATIECFYSENKATYVHTNENRSYIIDETLEELEDKLNPVKFFRISRKFFVRLESIKDIVSYTNSRLQLFLNSYVDAEIIVSRERVKAFKDWIGGN